MLPLLLAFLAGAAASLLVLHRFNAAFEGSVAETADESGQTNAQKSDPKGSCLASEHSTSPGSALQREELQAAVSSITELSASVEELQQVVANQRDNDAERIQDHMEVLFSAFSEGLKEELQQKQEMAVQRSEGELLALDIKMRHLDDLSGKLSAGLSALAGLNSTVRALQADVEELQVAALQRRVEEKARKDAAARELRPSGASNAREVASRVVSRENSVRSAINGEAAAAAAPRPAATAGGPPLKSGARKVLRKPSVSVRSLFKPSKSLERT